jgi:(p)ppGpp synthase/HD superfamily hydrolase
LARWVRAEWEKSSGSDVTATTYEAKLQITATDEIGVIAAISVTLADMKVSITQINTQPQKNGDMTINITIGCKNTSHYESIVSKLRSLKSIISVTRAFSQ